MRRWVIGPLIAALTASMVGISSPRDAAAELGVPVTSKIAVSVALAGFETPAAVWQNPCADDPPYTKFVSDSDGLNYRSGEVRLAVSDHDSSPDGQQYLVYKDVGAPYTYATISDLVPTDVYWVTACQDPATFETNMLSVNGFWVPVVSQETVVPALFAYLERYLQAPVLSWPSMDREFGWLYVKAPMDFRIVAPAAISLTATVTNVTGSVTASVSATPTVLAFEPGEPKGSGVQCSVAAATEGYSVKRPGACSYTYQNSSAIGFDARFGWRATLRWDVTTSSPRWAALSLPTSSYGTVQVAEAQAVVTG